MIYHHVLAAVLALDVAIAVGHLSPPLGKNIGQLESPLAIKAFAEPVYQKRGFSLKRQDLVGSWALRAITCPSNTETCDEGGSPAMLACCPKSTVCINYGYRIACCASSSRCDTTAATFPKCGDSSWSLWAGGRDLYFCCLSGQIGYLTADNRGACGPDTLKPTGSQIATAVQDVSGDQPPQTSAPSGNDGKTGNTSTTPNSSRTSLSSVPSITPNVSTGTKVNSPTDTSQTDNSQNQNPNGSSNTTGSSGSSGLPSGVIGGIVAGGVFILILAGVAIFFALKAGRNKGRAEAAEAIAAFQHEQRNLPGNNTYQSGVSTPGAVVPPMSPPPLPAPLPHGQHAQWTSDSSSVIAEKYGESRQVPPNPPPPQWSTIINHQDGPSYEADATNVYPSSNHAEMDGYQQQRGN
ncbi:hypothetical protein BGX38DRAFT_1146873 [Terfezia claveryi]|nr:hypothetical protein BGX38DRAFT_1146873 [Terfezia claveryi]